MKDKKDTILDAIKDLDLGTIKKPKEKIPFISDEDAVELVVDNKKISSFDDLLSHMDKGSKIKPKRWVIKHEDLSQWTQRDFAIYMSEKYYEKYKTTWSYSTGSVVTYISLIKKNIYEALGFCNNIVMKNYIDYFFKNWLYFYHDDLKKNTKWLFYMKHADPIEKFCDTYDYAGSLKKYLDGKEIPQKKKTKKLKKTNFPPAKQLEMACLLGLDNAILEYGVLFVCNYLVLKENYTIEKAEKEVAKTIYSLYNRKMKDKVEAITRKNVVCSDLFKIKTLDNINSILKKEYNISFAFVANYTFKDGPIWGLKK